MKTADIRNLFKELYSADHSGATVEILGASFEADEITIFGTPDQDYIQREVAWYYSQSLNVHDIPGVTPTIWLQVANDKGFINSNYGWCIWSKENGYQYNNVLAELQRNPYSRRATMIYNRPTMHIDCVANGMNDFICTNAVSYYIRNGALDAVVQMRSNDAVYGYKNDRAWQLEVQRLLSKDLNIPVGKLYWQVQNLHVYSRHYKLIEQYSKD